MATKNVITAEQMRRAVRAVERRMNVDWLTMISGVKGSLSIAQIVTMLDNGVAVQEVVRAATAGMGRWFARSWLPAYSESAEAAAAFLESGLGVPMSFDIMSLGPVRALQEHRFRLVRGFGAEQRRSSVAAFEAAFEVGANPRTTARAIRDSIGLTAHQERAVVNYRRALEEGSSSALDRQLRDRRSDSLVRRSVDEGGILKKPQIDRMVDRYRGRWLRYRSEVIARTESQRAVNGGQRDMFEQAISEGDLLNDQLLREWNTAIDERVRSSHNVMQGQEVEGINTPFVSGLGNQLLYPGDPGAPPDDTVQCRCAVGTRLTKIVVPV